MKLYSIGQASEMIGVPIPTIRYYDSVALCSPSFTDENSGYRYYSIDDIFKLDLIRCLGRQMGIPLKQIRDFLRESNDPEAIKKYLQQQEESINKQIIELQYRQKFISEKLAAIKLQEDLDFLSPRIERFEETKLIAHHILADCLEDAILLARKSAGDYSDLCKEIFLLIDSRESPISFFGKKELTVALRIDTGVSGSFPLILPGGMYASIYYQNRDEFRSVAYNKLFDYIKSLGYYCNGPLICSGSLIDTTSASSLDYVIKLSVPVMLRENADTVGINV